MLKKSLGMDSAVMVLDDLLGRRIGRRSSYPGSHLVLATDGKRVYYADSRWTAGLEFPISTPGVDLPASKVVFDDEIYLGYLSKKPAKMWVGAKAQLLHGPIPKSSTKFLEVFDLEPLGMTDTVTMILAVNAPVDRKWYLHMAVVNLDEKQVSHNLVARRSSAPLESPIAAARSARGDLQLGTIDWSSISKPISRIYRVDGKGGLQLIDRLVVSASGLGAPKASWIDVSGKRTVVAGSNQTVVWSRRGSRRFRSPAKGIIHTFLLGTRVVWVTTESGESGAPGSPCATTVQELGGKRQEIEDTYILAHSDNGKHLLVENAVDKSIWLLSRK